MRTSHFNRAVLTLVAATVLVAFSSCAKNETQPRNAEKDTVAAIAAAVPQRTITIAGFNTLHFGWKDNKSKDMDAFCKTLANYDVVGLLEVMKPELLGDVETKLKTLTKAEWKHTVSSRKLGRSTYKEYYAILYRADRTTLIQGSARIWNDVGDRFEREPFYASFRSDNFDYTVILMHSDFDSDKEVMRREARYLSGVFKAVQDADPKENDVLLIGDFNLSASDQGWDKLKSLPTVAYLVPATTLTTINPTGKPSSAYDNIWIQKQFTDWEFAGTANADYCFDEIFSSSMNPGKAWRQKVSDHAPVYAVFYTDRADDD